MNTKTSTPPAPLFRIANLPYSKHHFSEIISKMSKEQVFKISVEVWALDPNGKNIELLRSNLPMEEFDKISPYAYRMIFKGEEEDLLSIGAKRVAS